MIYGFMIGNIFLLVLGQMFWKLSVEDVKQWDVDAFTTVFTSPFFWFGGFTYAIATVCWLYVLSKMPLSVAYPFQSISYVFGAILAVVIFKETVTAQHWLGILVIILGVFLISR
ncbi:EamA family transporter [Salirhabdus salicampi]|uniref:EamA family transporter n=1 Tax=Salirhabdus salicampi TaxID=476102 RepID=UPI0020C4093A|nr:EamA family transporter [Salirhabdus salicampi]MCP8615836.1 EamA family transporter [Salirhabdus salicampi]